MLNELTFDPLNLEPILRSWPHVRYFDEDSLRGMTSFFFSVNFLDLRLHSRKTRAKIKNERVVRLLRPLANAP